MNTRASGSRSPQKAATEGQDTCHIDWLQFTVEWPVDRPVVDMITCEFGDVIQGWGMGEQLTPVRGYNTGLRIGNSSVYWHSQQPSQKVMVVLSGSDLTKIAQANISQPYLLAHVVTRSSNITRLDFAIDVFMSKGDPAELLTLIGTPRMTTKAKHATHISGYTVTDGEVDKAPTVYIGHPSSDRQLRVYHKGKEQGLTIDWLRIELVTRKPLARPLAEAMLRSTIADAGKTAVKAYVNCDLAWYRKAIEGKLVEIRPHIDPQRNTIKWLIMTALPVLQREALAEHRRGSSYLTEQVAILHERLQRNLTLQQSARTDMLKSISKGE